MVRRAGERGEIEGCGSGFLGGLGGGIHRRRGDDDRFIVVAVQHRVVAGVAVLVVVEGRRLGGDMHHRRGGDDRFIVVTFHHRATVVAVVADDVLLVVVEGRIDMRPGRFRVVAHPDRVRLVGELRLVLRLELRLASRRLPRCSTTRRPLGARRIVGRRALRRASVH